MRWVVIAVIVLAVLLGATLLALRFMVVQPRRESLQADGGTQTSTSPAGTKETNAAPQETVRGTAKARRIEDPARLGTRIVSALRCEKFVVKIGGVFGMETMTPSNPSEVIVVVCVRNVPDEWRDNSSAVRLEAGGQAIKWSVIGHLFKKQTDPGDPGTDYAVFAVPRDITELALCIGDHPPLQFHADRIIQAQIDDASFRK